ncbi:MAG: hypothetical protein K2X86_08090 [Cytophagaceae bacterium]|nr:hypothetical protein [Cytophagaceae bacterium]
MALYQIKNNGQLDVIKENDFKLEKEIQRLTEENLKAIFGLEIVKSEFTIGNFRIDTLAFNRDESSFAIIEYKKDKNFSVIDQGYAYLSLMLNNKADFILEYNESKKSALKRNDVEWSQSKVIFISPSFTSYQREAINFKDLPIELWEIKRFSNNTVNYSKIQTAGAKESVKTISRKDDTIEKVSKEIKVYTEQEHLEIASDEIKELYERMRTGILNLDTIEIEPKKHYIAFVGSTNIVDIHIQKNALKMWINLRKGDLNDPKKITRDVSSIGHWGNGDYQLHLQDDGDLEYVLSLIKQSVKRNRK